MNGNFETAPEDLPVPVDDGACNHLRGMDLPHTALMSTTGKIVDLSKINGRVVIYCYPMTGRPGVALPEGWDEIPGARGCTPQACSFRDHYAELKALGAEVFGLSTQDTGYQTEMAERLNLPFPVLSDANLAFCHALKLPTFHVNGKTLVKRVTLIVRDSVIEEVHYPVFPSASDPQWVIDYLESATG